MTDILNAMVAKAYKEDIRSFEKLFTNELNQRIYNRLENKKEQISRKFFLEGLGDSLQKAITPNDFEWVKGTRVKLVPIQGDELILPNGKKLQKGLIGTVVGGQKDGDGTIAYRVDFPNHGIVLIKQRSLVKA